MNKLKIVAAICALAIGSTSQAGLICGAAIANKVTANGGCQLGSTNNDWLNPLQVNIDQMFGFSDWLFAEKVIDTDSSIDVGFGYTGSLLNGTWMIDDIWSVYSEVMLVIKGAVGNNVVPTYVGYLLNAGDVTGNYATPFANANNGNPKDISHMSIYVRGSGSMTVPEPGVLILLGMGILAAGLVSRKS